jgi:endonuclease-3
MTKKQRYDAVLQWFEQNMPIAESELVFHNEYELLVAVMLSAQCTDKRVNMVTPKLFEQYPTPQTLAQASEEDIFQIIRSISYPNAKAKHLKGMAEKLISDYQGQVPNTVEALQTLPGVGRKTANVVCAVAWNQPTMAVDTHIFRVSERIGLTTHSKNPLQTEKQLIQYIPKELIPKAHHWLLLHGRYTCQARNPKCSVCGLQSICKHYSKNRVE